MVRVHHTDAVVVGSGIAGLSAALGLGSCTVLTRGIPAADGSSAYAQGGMAAALGPTDEPTLHALDTVGVSGGIGDPHAAVLLADHAAERIAWLAALGARFDRGAHGRLVLGHEAGHSRRRIVHADGDATGAEVMRALATAVAAAAGIDVVADTTVIDLLRDGRRVVGVVARHAGELVAFVAPAVVIATGGIGRLYSHTTNPAGVTGEGIAMAIRAGATVADMEFVQFHPTALDAASDPMPLLTEALRGEGATLVDERGSRIMEGVHPAMELAPRDVVARAIWRAKGRGRSVFLDARAAVGDEFPHRFPTVFALAGAAGFDPRQAPLPVSPAVHYFMGGIATDADGATSIPGLWACGEAASTGLHGANRLASNSLVEGLVYGARVADSIRAADLATITRAEIPVDATTACADPHPDIERYRGAMWRHAGIERTGDGLQTLLDDLALLDSDDRAHLGMRSLVTVGSTVARAALARAESRGGHHRTDHPAPDRRFARRSRFEPIPVPTQSLASMALRGAA